MFVSVAERLDFAGSGSSGGARSRRREPAGRNHPLPLETKGNAPDDNYFGKNRGIFCISPRWEGWQGEPLEKRSPPLYSLTSSRVRRSPEPVRRARPSAGWFRSEGSAP